MRGLYHNQAIDLARRREGSRIADARTFEQRVLVLGLVAFFGAQEATITEERDEHPPLDLVVRVALVEVDFERPIGDEDRILCEQPLLNVFGEETREVRKLERFVDATPRRVRASCEVSRVRLVSARRGYDEVAQAERARAVRDVECGMAAHGAQGERTCIVPRECGTNVRRRRHYEATSSCA
ncbi:MAG: hypothetical protein NVS4B5_11610 [Vulcanimicrobiaceae bacterium]